MSSAMKQQDFDFISDIIKKRSGLALTQEKVYLLESRLLPIARQHGQADLPALITFLRTNQREPILAEITEAMTTNESSFFRDAKPYERFSNLVMPKIKELAGARKTIRIWSAACSNGQEPYSIAICLEEDAVKYAGYSFDIIATDLATKVLDKARKGVYTQFEVQRGLPIQKLIKYFTQQPDGNWQVNEKLRAQVTYRQQNLLEDFGTLGKFDIIFCRNVLIYFDEPTKTQVFERMHRAMNPGGMLFLGSSESILGVTNKFKAVENERGIFTTA